MNPTRTRASIDSQGDDDSRRKRARRTEPTRSDDLQRGRNDSVLRCCPPAQICSDKLAHDADSSFAQSRGKGPKSKNDISGCCGSNGDHVPATQCSKISIINISPRQNEYDEGMYIYCDSLELVESLSESVRLATLLFNDGQTSVRLGKYEEAKTAFEESLRTLIADDGNSNLPCFPIMAVMIHHNLGHCYYRVGQNEEAMRSYSCALSVSQNAGLNQFHMAAAINSIAVLLFHSEESDFDKILNFFKASLCVYRNHFGGESRQVATVLNNMGRVHYLSGSFDEALVAYREALKIRRRILGDSLDVAATVCNTGQAYQQLGELSAAMEHYREFLGLVRVRNHPGSTNRDVAMVFKCMAEINQGHGKLEEAKRMYEMALRAGRSANEPDQAELASILNKLGNVCYEMKDLNTALMHYNEGLDIERDVLEENHPHIIVTLMNIAQIHRHRGNLGAAFIKYSEVYSMQLQSVGDNSLDVASTLSNMALMQYQMKAYASAFDFYQEALRIQREHFGSEGNLDVAATLNSMGLVLFNRRLFDLAKVCFTDSLNIRRKILGPDHKDVAILYYNIATIHLEMGEDEVAIKLYKETLRVEQKALGQRHDDVILTLQHLALVHQQRGELDEALGFFESALELERAKEDGSRRVSVAKLLNLVGNIHLQRGDVGAMMEKYSEASRIYRERPDQSETLVIAGYNFYGLSKLHPPSAPEA